MKIFSKFSFLFEKEKLIVFNSLKCYTIFLIQVADDRMALVANSQMDLELGLNSTKAARLPPEWYVIQLAHFLFVFSLFMLLIFIDICIYLGNQVTII